MPPIPDITDTERWFMQTTLKEWYGREMELDPADAGIRPRPSDRVLKSCPVISWQVFGGCGLVVFKSGARGDRCQLF
jgi:hypothetical protein